MNELQYLQGFLRLHSSFGNSSSLFSDIEFNVKTIKPRQGKSGFFYEIPPFGNFNDGSDLHISIFDSSGFAKAHITFKPYKNGNLAFHYGYKFKNSKYEEFWTTGKNNYPEETVDKIYNDIEWLYYEILDLVYVNRTNKSPYKFNLSGTAGRINDPNKKEFALSEYYAQQRTPPSFLKPRTLGYQGTSPLQKRRLF